MAEKEYVIPLVRNMRGQKMEIIENRMVVYPTQESIMVDEVKERLSGTGYREMKTGIFVPEEDAFNYAMERISQDEDLKQEFNETVVEWFYSENWIKED